MLFDVANSIALTNSHQQSNSPNQSNELTESKNYFVIDKLLCPKEK